MHILSIHCNPKPVEQSACRTVADKFLLRMQELYPQAMVTHHDLYLEDIPEMDLSCYSARAVLTPVDDTTPEETRHKIARIRELVQEVRACDRLILAAPLWNLGLPGRLKNYLDCLVLQGETVHISNAGIKGMLEDKERKALFIQSSGGSFGHLPMSLLNLGWHQLRTTLSAMGFDTVRLLPVDDCGSTHQSWEKAICRATLRIEDTLREF